MVKNSSNIVVRQDYLILVNYGTRIDNNGLPGYNDGPAGPTWRGLDEGVGSPGYFGPDHPTHFPQSKTLPGEVDKSKSLLQELDEE